VLIFGLVAMGAVFAAGLVWTVRRFSIATRDALDLAEKLRVPRPVHAVDWPEVRIDELVTDPAEPTRVLVALRWPARASERAVLLLQLEDDALRSVVRLARWRDRDAALTPRRDGDPYVVLRRRGGSNQVRARVIDERPWDGGVSDGPPTGRPHRQQR
jgi:hypothetical protein